MANRDNHNYIHIPKTGGTALKYVIEEHNADPNKPNPRLTIDSAGHNKKLSNTKDACFIIRHPWDRFCSGFWERVTMPERQNLSNTEYKNVKGFGYKNYTDIEKDILDKCKTPDQFLTYIRNGGKTEGANPGLFELTASITNWIGNLENFKQNEDKIKLVYHINNLDKVAREVYNINLPTDPFKRRSRALFNFEQTYELSPQNRSWFENEFRKQDYEIIAYIKTRNYYYE